MSSAKIARNLLLISVLTWFFYVGQDQTGKIAEGLSFQINYPVQKIADYLLQIGFWLSLAFLVRELINFFFTRKYLKSGSKSGAPKLIKDLLVILVFFVDLMLIMHNVFQQPITGIWITSGAMAIVLGFALRNIILDLFSGIAVNIEKPYQIGDWIEIHQRFAQGSIVGQVTDITWRATHIRTEENTNVVLPNSLITTMAMTTNFWHNSKPTRYEIKVNLDFSIPFNKAKRILYAASVEAINNEGFVPEKTPQILIDGTNDMGVVYKIRYWITPWHSISPSSARDIVYSCVLKHIRAAGITLAYPKEDVYHAPMPNRNLNTFNEDERTIILSQIDLFSILKESERKKLSHGMIHRAFKPGDVIFKQGDDGNSMFVILEGLVNVKINEGPNEILAGILAPSDFFGEMSLLTGDHRSATIECMTEVVVFEICFIDFQNILQQRDEIVELIADKVYQRKFKNDNLIESEREGRRKQSEDQRRSLISKIRKYFSGSSIAV